MSKEKKYEFTGEELKLLGRKLKRVRRLEDGMVGGWIEHEGNLSHAGRCWIADEAKVLGNAGVSENAYICGLAVVHGNASVGGASIITGRSKIGGFAIIAGCAHVHEYAQISGESIVSGNAMARDNAKITNRSVISGNICIRGDMECSISPTVVDAKPFSITISDNYIKIGCKVKTLEEWRRETPRTVGDYVSEVYFRFYEDVVPSLWDVHQKTLRLRKEMRS